MAVAVIVAAEEKATVTVVAAMVTAMAGVAALAAKETATAAATTVTIGGPVEKMCFFQMAPTPPLSVLICSTRYQYDILKVWLRKK